MSKTQRILAATIAIIVVAPLAVYGGIKGANSILPKNDDNPAMTCWNLKVGRMITSGNVYYLGLLSERYESLAEDVSAISKDLTISVLERRSLCEKYSDLI